MSSDVFISYTQPDKVVADEICAWLEEEKIMCWIAPRNILGGMPWGEAIIDAITESRLMVLVFSSHCNKSPFILRELERAVSMRLHLVPFWIEDVRPSKGIEFYTAAMQRVDAYPEPSNEDFEALVEIISGLLAKEDKQPAERDPEFDKGLWHIEDFLRKKQWDLCAKKSIEIFESALKRTMKNMLDELEDSGIRNKITATQEGSGQDGLTVEHLGLDRLIGLFSDADIFRELQKQKLSNLHRTTNIDWKKVLYWHDAIRCQSDIDCNKENAMELANWTKVLLYECELVGAHIDIGRDTNGGQPSSKTCFHCEKKIKKDWKYCSWCGIPLNLNCEACGNKLEPGFKICPFCETRVSLVLASKGGKMYKAHNEYGTLCKGVYLDDTVTLREKELLIEKRLELGLTVEETLNIERQYAPKNSLEYTGIVQGVLVDGVITRNERGFLDEKRKELHVPKWIADNIEEVESEIRRREMNKQRERK